MNNVAAESLLLASFIHFPQSFFDVADYVSEKDFSHPGHAMIYEAIKSLYMDKQSDSVSRLKLISEAKNLGFEDFKGKTQDYHILDQALTATVQEADALQAFQTVKRFSILRKYDEQFLAKRKYIQNTKDSLSDIITSIEKDIFEIPDIAEQGRHQILPLMKNAKRTVEELAKEPGHVGIDVGLPIWQRKAGQVRNAGVTFIVATGKTGKTQFGMGRAVHVGSKYKLPVLYCDSELSEQDQIIRIVGMYAKIPYEVIETGYWKLSPDELLLKGISQEELPKYAEYQKRMNDPVFWQKAEALPIDYMSISGLPMEEVIPRIRRWIMTKVKPSKKSKVPECLIIYDYIKLATLDELRGGKVGEHQVHGLNMAALHEMCQRHNVPVLAFGQTNREIDDNINCVAGAKRITDLVTSTTLLKRKSDEELGFDPTGDHLLRIFAGRFGAGTGNSHININFDKTFGEIIELGYSGVNFAAKRAEKLSEWKKKRKFNDDDED